MRTKEWIYGEPDIQIPRKFCSKTQLTATEVAETYLADLHENKLTGTYLISYRGGRPIRIREVKNI